ISPRQQLVSAPYAMQAQNATAAVSAGFATNAASLVNETKGQVVSVTGTNVVVNGSISGYGTFPLGGIIMWSGATVPSGWALCDGNNNTPDLRGRFVLGSGTGSGLTARSVGQAGGEENHALTTSEMPSHTHGVTDPGHGHNFTFHDSESDGWNGGAFQLTDRTPRNTGAAELLPAFTGISLQSNGSNTAHNTMPPFYVLAYIMRVQ
ncbi:MAG: tail fiber protein, partial [Verrucomicrobia bacterium]|nr:tail fiber protein [Verrucomicrobiota bacterium]